MNTRDPSRTPVGILPLVAALAVLCLHAWLLVGWIVDDAGITFAYARNFAAGHGLVSQPGRAPVEGFSNPLWTLTIGALYAVGMFDPRVTPKILGVALAAGVLLLIWQDLRFRTQSSIAVALPLALLAACSPFVIWTTSGLENGLLAVLVIASARLSIAASSDDEPRAARDVAAGVIAAMAALTRPDALVYAGLYPAAALLGEARRGWPTIGRVSRRSALFASGLAPIYGSYLLFRLRYFDDLLPNTFYAKAKPSLGAVSAGALLDLVESAGGDLYPLVILFLLVCLIGLLRARRLAPRTLVLAGYLAGAALVFLVMPSDWMGEFRFATPFYPLLFWTLAESAIAVAPFAPAWSPRAFQLAAIAFTLQAVIIYSARTLAFADRPTVPLREVQAYAGQGFNRLAEALGGDNLSMLTPDLGGALLDSRMQVYDLAGLCDRRIARALSEGNTAPIQEYVFGEIKPSFIHMHGAFVRASRLPDDPRFQRDYVAIHEHREGPPEWRPLWNGSAVPAWSGDYVRRELLGPDQDRRQALASTYRRYDLSRFVPWVRPPDRLQRGWPQLAWAAETLSARVGRSGLD